MEKYSCWLLTDRCSSYFAACLASTL